MDTVDEDPPMRRRESIENHDNTERRHSAGSLGAAAQEAVSSSDASDSHRAKAGVKQAAAQDDSALVTRLITRIAELEQKLYQHDLSDAQEAAPRAGRVLAGHWQDATCHATFMQALPAGGWLLCVLCFLSSVRLSCGRCSCIVQPTAHPQRVHSAAVPTTCAPLCCPSPLLPPSAFLLAAAGSAATTPRSLFRWDQQQDGGASPIRGETPRSAR